MVSNPERTCHHEPESCAPGRSQMQRRSIAAGIRTRPQAGPSASACRRVDCIPRFRHRPPADWSRPFQAPTARPHEVPTFVNEFWTARQRQASSLHEVSYRACFKPQLPRFFIERLTQPGDVVYDPFMGRGTTLLEAALLGRVPWATTSTRSASCSPAPACSRPPLKRSRSGLRQIDLTASDDFPEDLLVFYPSRHAARESPR